MGSLMSIDKQIDQLWFKPFPTKAVEIVKIARTGSIIVALSKSGILYTNSPELIKKLCYAPTRNSFFDDVAVCLRKLGVITPKQLKSHKDWSIRVHDRQRAQDRMESIEYRFKQAGLELTAEQREKLERDAGGRG